MLRVCNWKWLNARSRGNIPSPRLYLIMTELACRFAKLIRTSLAAGKGRISRKFRQNKLFHDFHRKGSQNFPQITPQFHQSRTKARAGNGLHVPAFCVNSLKASGPQSNKQKFCLFFRPQTRQIYRIVVYCVVVVVVVDKVFVANF